MFSVEAAANVDLPADASIVDILRNPRVDNLLIGGPYATGLSSQIFRRANPNGTHNLLVDDPTNLAGFYIAVAAVNGKHPRELIGQVDIPIEEVTPKVSEVPRLDKLVNYASRWEAVAQHFAQSVKR